MKSYFHFPKTKTSQFLIWLVISITLLFLTQGASYQYETINWDESTFTIQGADLLRGNLPYINTLDSKPPFLYVNFAAALLFFGKSVASVRLLGDLMIFFTSFFIYLVIRRLSSTDIAAVASWLFISMTAVSFAQYTSSEVIAIFYLMLSIWVQLNIKRTPVAALLAGILMSLTVLVRTNLALTAIAGVLIYIFDYLIHRNRKALICVFNYIIGGLTPLFIIFAIYSQQNALEYLELGMVNIPLSYSAARHSIWGLIGRHGYIWLKYMKLLPLIIVPISALVVFVIISTIIRFYRNSLANQSPLFQLNKTWLSQAAMIIYLVVLLVATFVSILLSGGVYSHYQIQLYPLLIVLLFVALSKNLNEKNQQLLIVFLSLIMLSNLFYAKETITVLSNINRLEDDFPGKKIASISSQHLNPDDEILAFEQHITLLYLDKNPIAPILTHPSNFSKPSYINVLYSEKAADSGLLQAILDKNPKIILIQSDTNEWIMSTEQKVLMTSTLNTRYQLLDTIENCSVYVRISQ